MNVLLFAISMIFSVLFFVFHRLHIWESSFLWYQTYNYNISSLSGNLLIESGIFFCFALFVLIYFSSLNFMLVKKEQSVSEIISNEEHKQSIKNILSWQNIKIFFKEYVYYIGCVCFYFSMYLFLRTIWIDDVSYFILFLNIIIGWFFFLTQKSSLFKDFIRINTILFSLYYIFVYFCIIFLDIFSLGSIDIVNTLCILLFFIISLYLDTRLLPKRDLEKKTQQWEEYFSDSAFVLYFCIYSFIVCVFYWSRIFWWLGVDFVSVFMILWCIFSSILYFFVIRLSFFKDINYILRGLSFIFLYISAISASIILAHWISDPTQSGLIIVISVIILIYSIIFNWYNHMLFENYVSLLFSLLSSVYIVVYIAVVVNNHYNIFFMPIWVTTIIMIMSFFWIFMTYMYKQVHLFDYYFIHIICYVLNIGAIIYFLYYGQGNLSHIASILLIESLFIFMSSYKLRKI